MLEFSVEQANALGNWSWGTNAVGLIIGGLLSDHFRVRKPFMLVGGIGGAVAIYFYLTQAGLHPNFTTLAIILCAQSMFVGFAYVSWMASFTETVEARNPALTATGLALWGWLLRLPGAACLVAPPLVVKSADTATRAPPSPPPS